MTDTVNDYLLVVFAADGASCMYVKLWSINYLDSARTAEDFFVPRAAIGTVCSVLIDHQQITSWHFPHTISILEVFVINSIASKLGFPELHLHSLVHCIIILSN
jgi:hypothetical protein